MSHIIISFENQFVSMRRTKVGTRAVSITLSEENLALIDNLVKGSKEHESRSSFIDKAISYYIAAACPENEVVSVENESIQDSEDSCLFSLSFSLSKEKVRSLLENSETIKSLETISLKKMKKE